MMSGRSEVCPAIHNVAIRVRGRRSGAIEKEKGPLQNGKGPFQKNKTAYAGSAVVIPDRELGGQRADGCLLGLSVQARGMTEAAFASEISVVAC